MQTLPKLQKLPEVQRGKADKIANIKRTGREVWQVKFLFQPVHKPRPSNIFRKPIGIIQRNIIERLP